VASSSIYLIGEFIFKGFGVLSSAENFMTFLLPFGFNTPQLAAVT